MITHPQTVQETVNALEEAVTWSVDNTSQVGYFAAWYQALAQRVYGQLQQGAFKHPAEVEQVFVRMVGRYLIAFDAYKNTKSIPSDAWKYYFSASSAWSPIVLQHVLMGVHTVANLDLKVAMLQVESAEKTRINRHDIEQMWTLMEEVMEEKQRMFRALWPRLRTLEPFIGIPEKSAWGLEKEHSTASRWAWINQVSLFNPAEQAIEIVKLDRSVVGQLQRIRHPGVSAGMAILAIRLSERGTVQEKTSAILR